MAGRIYYPAARGILQVVFDGFGADARDSDPYVIPVLPKSVVIHRNSYRQADSWEMTFEANDLPIDPQLIRAGAAEIYLFSMPTLDDERRVPSRQFSGGEDPVHANRRPATGALEVELGMARAKDRFTFDNRPMIVGLFDDHSIEMSNQGKWVTISGQDYTAYLIGKQWPPTDRGTARRIPTGKRLDVWLGDILREADPDRRLTVLTENIRPSELPMVGAGEVRTNKRGIPIEQETSYWDVIYKVVTRYGFITFVRGLDVVITRPKNIHDLASHDVKRLAWGNDVETLKLTRHLGKERVPRIVVKGYDPKRREGITVEYPDGALKKRAKTFKPSASGRTTSTEKIKAATKHRTTKETLRLEDEFQIIPVFGVSDRAVLRRMAENLFQLLGRSERRMVVTTRDLRDMEGASLMDVTSGDAVEVEWLDFNRELIASPDVPESSKFQHLVSRGFNETVARAIASQYTKLLGIKRPMRVREVTYEFDVEDGLSIEMELIDFVVVDGTRDADQCTPRKQSRAERIRDAQGRPIGNPALETRR